MDLEAKLETVLNEISILKNQVKQLEDQAISIETEFKKLEEHSDARTKSCEIELLLEKLKRISVFMA
jgi:predicted  nucleic acid-binding Zn-ribbon protein